MKNRLMALLALLFVSIPCLGQLNRGTVTGTIADSSGAVIPGVRVSIRNTATSAIYKTGSSGVGQYNMPNLPTGSYEITFEAVGFKRLVREGIDVGTTQVVRVDVNLEVGAVTENVVITTEVPRLQTDTPETATTLSSKQLIDLPLTTSGARKAENLFYQIAPGVTGGTWTSQINGSMNFSKETLLDGASTTTYMPGDFNESASSIEALQEVKILTSGISAEFGRMQSGVFNYILKSGANEIHGSAYVGLRNEALNANTFANTFRGVPKAKNRERANAVSFGGPVFIPKLYDGRNRTFFYIAHERYHVQNYTMTTPNRSAPVPEFYEGDFSRLLGPATAYTDALGRPVLRGAIYDPATFYQLPNGRWIGDMFPGNVIPKVRFSQVSERLNAFAKQHILPTVRDASGQIPLLDNMAFPSANYLKSDYNPFSIKVDQNISSTQKLSGSYSYVYQPRVIADGGGSLGSQ